MNFKEICRTCLRSGEMMSSLFDEEIELAKHTAADLLVMFTSVQVDKEDDFPHNICYNCLKEIQQAYLFDLKCRKSEIILHQLREIRVNLKKLKEVPKRSEIVSEVAGELENILKEDFKLEDAMNLCDRNIYDSESNAFDRIRSVEEENANANEKLNLRIVEEEFTQDLLLAFKREPEQSKHIKNDTNEEELERIEIVSNFQIIEDFDPQITLKQEPNCNSLIIRNNPPQNEPNQNSSNFEILDECAPEYQVIFNTEPDQNNLIIKGNKNGNEFSEISSKFQVAEEECVADFHVTFKSEPELDIGIDCQNERLKCSDCLKQFESLDTFRSHIVSNHLKENICKLCNEVFECSQFEHSVKHLPYSDPENPSGSSEESIRQTEKVQMTVIHKDEYRLVNHLRTHTSTKPFDLELRPEKSGNSSNSTRTKHTDELINDDKPIPVLQCSVCYKVFGVKWRLRKHMRVHTGEKPFQCKLCPAKFGHSNTLLYHRRIKHTDELISNDKSVADFQCSVCYKICGQKSLLRDHMRVHTGEKPFNCKLCPEKFRNSSALLSHRRTKHTNEFISDDKPVPDFQCSICYKVFGLKCILRTHMRTHTGEKPFDCELCPEKFRDRLALLCHRRTKHTDALISHDKPVPDFQCSVCCKVFGMKYKLKNHMRVHTGEKPFNCVLCPAKFGHSKTLLNHRRTKHTDEFISDDKPVPDFQCSICYKVFGLKTRLKNHMRVHTGENPIDCELCPEELSNSTTLESHRRTDHTDELISDDKPVPDFQCNICYKVFGVKCKLKDHMRVHTGEKPFHCELCPEKFRNSGALLYHRRTKHTEVFISADKPVPDFQCSICYKAFGRKSGLKNHMHVHTGENPFNCTLCPEKFQRSDALRIHVQRKHTDQVTEDYKCNVCSKVFAFKCSLMNHMRMHTIP